MPHATSSCETFKDFLKLHQEQLVLSTVPERFWDTLWQKLKEETFDAGEAFIIAKVEEIDEEDEQDAEDAPENPEEPTPGGDGEEADECVDYSWQVMVKVEEGIKASDPKQIYLIDHAWTFRIDKARHQLESIPGLLDRMVDLMDISTDGDNEDKIETVLSEMWKYNQTYQIGNAELGSESAVPLFYILDEFGSRIQHSDNPNFKTAPFCYVPRQISYTLMWPVKDSIEGDEVTRDYMCNVTDSLIRKLRLLPWFPEDMKHLSYELHEKDDSFFSKYKIHESLPNLDVSFPGLAKDRNVKVFTNVDQVEQFLTDPRFERVQTSEEADILWTRNYLKDFKRFSEETPHKYVNQYPMEMVLTVKDLFSMVARRAAKDSPVDLDTLESRPPWLQASFNLENELPEFVSYFQTREERGLDNYWICKPWNLSRGLDIHVTNNLNYILRLPDTGPKIACKYVEEPVLFEVPDKGLLKFDLRFVIMVSSVQPLRLHVHEKFIVRFANKPFSMDHFDDYEKHCTVMNYKGLDMIEMVCEDFVGKFEAQYPDFSWSSIEKTIYTTITELFDAATSQRPPKGISPSPQSRAIYGIDVMLKWTTDDRGDKKIQPVVLEVNFGPDNLRLCQTYPYFMNDIFSVLFLEDFDGRPVASL